MRRADRRVCATAERLSRQMISTTSLFDLGSLTDQVSEDLRNDGLIEGHLLAIVETLVQADGGKPQIRVMSSNLNQDLRFRYLDSQVNTLIDTSIAGLLPNTPRFWPSGESAWVAPRPDFRLAADRKTSLPISLFSLVSAQTFGFIAIEAKPDFHTGHLHAFHSIGLQLLDRVATVSEPAPSVLNRSEKRCLYWSACGKTSHEIALILDLSEHTVNHYIAIASSKLNARNRVHAVAKAIRFGLIRMTEIS